MKFLCPKLKVEHLLVLLCKEKNSFFVVQFESCSSEVVILLSLYVVLSLLPLARAGVLADI